jgi:hypothetical protein
MMMDTIRSERRRERRRKYEIKRTALVQGICEVLGLKLHPEKNADGVRIYDRQMERRAQHQGIIDFARKHGIYDKVMRGDNEGP